MKSSLPHPIPLAFPEMKPSRDTTSTNPKPHRSNPPSALDRLRQAAKRVSEMRGRGTTQEHARHQSHNQASSLVRNAHHLVTGPTRITVPKTGTYSGGGGDDDDDPSMQTSRHAPSPRPAHTCSTANGAALSPVCQVPGCEMVRVEMSAEFEERVNDGRRWKYRSREVEEEEWWRIWKEEREERKGHETMEAHKDVGSEASDEARDGEDDSDFWEDEERDGDNGNDNDIGQEEVSDESWEGVRWLAYI
ncbi:hypothetical protein BJ170DRAFT_638270, partial [Xylariales sp. AK1849]